MDRLLYELDKSAELAHVLMRQNKGESSKYHQSTFKECTSSICSQVKKVLREVTFNGSHCYRHGCGVMISFKDHPAHHRIEGIIEGSFSTKTLKRMRKLAKRAVRAAQ